MRIRWDAALTAATARALDARHHGARVRALALDPVARRAILYLRELTIAWELHPERLGMHLLEARDPPPEARRLPARLRRVWAPADDRVLILEMRRIRGRPARSALVLELIPNQENALFLEGEDDTVRMLLRTREGNRVLRRGQPYLLPPGSTREGADRGGEGDGPGGVDGGRSEAPVTRERWTEVVEGLPDREARGAILRSFAWTSPIVAPALLGADGYDRWTALKASLEGDPAPAAVIAGRHGPQPYPMALPAETMEHTDDILDAFRRTDELSHDEAPALLPGDLLDALASHAERARSRVASLELERDRLRDPEELQGWGDLLLARFHLVPSGADEVVLEGFDGSPVRIPMDPKLPPDANARRHYDRAGKVRRAAEELPGRIGEARARWEKLDDLLQRARAGDAHRDEVEAAIPRRAPGAGGGGHDGPSLPYRIYRSSGGIEIRVGRGSAKNDDLTFRHSRPNDVWLHARHAAGAHVILRWSEDGAPPARDLEEAAVLAALNSKARTSGSVPVDWTRRKHVRKPRKAPAGSVLPGQVQTVFVTPDPAVAEALREE